MSDAPRIVPCDGEPYTPGYCSCDQYFDAAHGQPCMATEAMDAMRSAEARGETQRLLPEAPDG